MQQMLSCCKHQQKHTKRQLLFLLPNIWKTSQLRTLETTTTDNTWKTVISFPPSLDIAFQNHVLYNNVKRKKKVLHVSYRIKFLMDFSPKWHKKVIFTVLSCNLPSVNFLIKIQSFHYLVDLCTIWNNNVSKVLNLVSSYKHPSSQKYLTGSVLQLRHPYLVYQQDSGGLLQISQQAERPHWK